MNKQEKRELAARRYIKSIDENRPNYKGYFIQDGKQCFCDGYSGVILNNKINNIQEALKTQINPKINLSEVFKGYDELDINETYSINDIRSNKTKIDNKCYTMIGGNKFLYKRISTIIGMLGDKIKVYTKITKYDLLKRKTLILENENGRAIMLCNDKVNNWRYI